jgi:hypothetical protein
MTVIPVQYRSVHGDSTLRDVQAICTDEAYLGHRGK